MLPGIVPQFIKKINEETGIPVIAGGLIYEVDEVKMILEAGAKAITTSRENLWNY